MFLLIMGQLTAEMWNIKAAFLVDDLLPLIPEIRLNDMVIILNKFSPTHATIQHWCRMYKYIVDRIPANQKTYMKQVLTTYMEKLEHANLKERLNLGRQILRDLQQTGVPRQLVDPKFLFFYKERK